MDAFHALLARQHSVVTRQQALRAGLTSHQVDRLLSRRELIPLHRGVFRRAGVAPYFEQSVMGACLAVDGVASGTCAARLLNVRRFRGAGIEVTTAARFRGELDGVTLHRRILDPRDRARLGPIPITTPARTLLDVAALAPDRLEAALADALHRGLTRVPLVYLTLTRANRLEHPGAHLLAGLLGAYDEGRAPTHSELEDAFVDMVRRYGLPEPVRQYPLLHPPVDFAFLPWPVAAETDGWRFHRSKAARANDRRRDREARALGWSLVRVSWDDLVERAGEVAADLAHQLRRAA